MRPTWTAEDQQPLDLRIKTKPFKFQFPFSHKDKGLFVQCEAVNSNIKLHKYMDKPCLFW